MAVKIDRTKTRPDNTDSKRLAPQGNAESDLPLHSETTDDGETGGDSHWKATTTRCVRNCYSSGWTKGEMRVYHKGAAGVDGWSAWIIRCQTDRNYRAAQRSGRMETGGEYYCCYYLSREKCRICVRLFVSTGNCTSRRTGQLCR